MVGKAVMQISCSRHLQNPEVLIFTLFFARRFPGGKPDAFLRAITVQTLRIVLSSSSSSY